MVNAAIKSKKINMVNFTYRESSAYQRLVEIIKSGDIGHLDMLVLVIINHGLQVINGVIGEKKINGYGGFQQNMEAMVLWVTLVFIFLILL